METPKHEGHIDLTIEEGDAASDSLAHHLSLQDYPFPLPPHADNTIDLSTDQATNTPDLKPIELRPYDSRPHEDKARRNIAYILLSTLGIVIMAAMVMFALVDPKNIGDLKDFISIIMGPLVALVSAATGFYYAGKK